MTNEDFSNNFDTLVSSYLRFKDFDNKENLDSIEFDEYEKSVFLTRAQEEIVVSLYTGRNNIGKGFEETEELREYLNPLVSSHTFTIEQSGKEISIEIPVSLKLWFIVYESLSVSGKKCETDTSLDVYPVTLDEYDRVKRNPFRGANDRRALRLGPIGNTLSIVSKYNITGYSIKYLHKPRPIILEDLPNELEIDGVSIATTSELPDTLHQRILELAVQEALQSKGYTVKNKTSDK